MTADRPPNPQANARQSRKPTQGLVRRMEWGRKAINLDLTTGRDRGTPVTWPVQTGGWVTQDGPADGKACGQGLHAALTVRGLSSVHRLAEAIVLPVGWLPEDVLGRDDDKVRVRRLWVIPCPMSLPAVLRDGWGVGANLRGANLGGADLGHTNLRDANLWSANLGDADLWSANLGDADLGGAVAARWTRWPDGFDPEAAGVTVR